MTTPASFSEQILALPAGAGGVNGLGETFGADPYTGTGRYRIPIALPEGHRGTKPELALVYSSGAGAGICGAGWSFGVGAIRRRTDKGVPTYTEEDVFLLGDEELVPVEGGFFVRRAEGAFARIRRVAANHEDLWAVTDRTGVRRLYGRLRADREGPEGRTRAWLLSEICDPNDNRVTYTWERDVTANRSYLSQIEWGAGAFRVVFTYVSRPDILRNARAGYLERTDRLLSRIDVQVRRTSDGTYATFDRFELTYTVSPITGLSLLASVTRTGFSPTGASRAWPTLSMHYAQPAVGPKPMDIEGHPGRALSDPDLSLCDIDGDGLPDLLDSTSSGWVLRRNLGQARFATPVPIRGPAARLREEGVFFADLRGSGLADLVTPSGLHANEGEQFGTFRPFDRRPSFDLRSPDARLIDVDGDGVGDVVVQSGRELLIFGNEHAQRHPGGRPGLGFLPARRVPVPERLPRLDDPWTRVADIDGDGLADWVRVSRGAIEVFSSLGHGRFAEPRLLPFPEALPPTLPASAIHLADVTGTGCADVIVRLAREVWIFPNATGERLGAKIVVHTRALSERGTFEAIDLLGSGTKGLLYTEPGNTHAWTFYRLFEGRKPDLLEQVNNGLGLQTTVNYGSSLEDTTRDRARAEVWRYPLPFPVVVVHSITVDDAVSDTRATTRYAYHHGYYDASEREFRGFAVVDQYDTEVDAAETVSSPPARTRRFYDVGNGLRLRDLYAVVPGATLADEFVPSHPLARRALRGSMVREEVYADDGSIEDHRPYLVTHTTHRVVAVLGPVAQEVFFAAVARTDSWHTERTGEARHVVTQMVYDRYGRTIEVRERGEGRLGSFSTAHEQQQTETLERYTRTTYLTRTLAEPDDYDGAYTPTWLLDVPAIVERWGVDSGGDTLLSREQNFYDGDDFEGLGYPSAPSGVVRGNLSCTLQLAHTDALLNFPSGSGGLAARDARGNFLSQSGSYFLHAARMAYGAHGMPIASRDPNGNETTVSYDGTHELFPVQVVDALLHPTTLERGEFPYQVAAVVDANDNRTEFVYDPTGLPASRAVMGKFVSSAWEGDPPSHPTEVYEYDFETTPIRVTTKTRQIREGATFDVHRYIDGVGRTVQERQTAEPDPGSPSTPRYRVTGWQLYNHKGLVVRAYQPVFSNSSVYATGNTSVPFIETLYDPLGRPTRVNHPDGTYGTTDYHPWVQSARDRNDNAGALTAADPRYGAQLSTFRSHLNTPTRTYVDAFGRSIAVSEDNGAGVLQGLRVTIYEVTGTEFSGTSYDLILSQALSANYFVMIRGSVADNNTSPSNSGVRVTQDPFGTGDLAASSGSNVLRLERVSSSQGSWEGSITVVECLNDAASSGFTLLDIKTVSFSAATSGNEQSVSVTCASWSDLSKVALYGGWYGGGASSSQSTTNHQTLFAALSPSGSSTLSASRWRIATDLDAADLTVYVVQWGVEHQIQRVTVTGNNGDDGLDATGEWNTASISPVPSAHSWVHASGWTKTNGSRSGFSGTAVTLGDGVSVPDVASTVAVANETSTDHNVIVTVHTHPSLLVHHVRKLDGDSTASSKDITTTIAGETETYDETGPILTTTGLRIPSMWHSSGSSNTAFARATWWTRFTGASTLRVSRQQTGDAWVGCAQAIDTVGLVAPDASSPALHVTRSVLNLRDEVVEVWDARGLSEATWKFSYDFAGRRTKAEHTTGTGSRWSLMDAAGNPIWSRDARGIEVDRTFDGLNRPLSEESDDGSTVKLRRMWTYMTYNAGDSSSKSKNLFGRVEEERDGDGLRYFEYDWRGLITKVSHKFWDADWQNASWTYYSNNDEAAVPSTARGSLSVWLSLSGLTDTTTVVVTTSYDAAGRPTEEVWPEGMKRRWTYNAAGSLEKVEYDRTGAGYAVGVEACSYNARGQLTGYTHGNGVVCSREYDTDTERLTRMFARKTSGGEVRFQDLVYAYDPVGNPVQITDQLATSTYTSNQIVPNTRTFRYDPRYRLVRATGKRHKDATDGIDAPVVPSPSLTDYVPYTHRYSYDAVGNFTTNQEYKSGTNNLNYKSGAPDLFDGYGSESYSYDANGCCTVTPRHAEMGYSFDSQPVFVDMGGGTQVRYRRHGDQRVVRFLTKNGGVSALGVYLGPWEYHRREGSTAYTKVVLHVEAHSRCAQAEVVLSGADSNSLSVFHVHADHLGSAQVLTKSDATLLAQEEFFAYGRSSDRRDSRARYRYIGVERDEDTGLCMTGPRTYDAVVGRFFQGDPLTSMASPFAYCTGSPLGLRDVDGRAPVPGTTDPPPDLLLQPPPLRPFRPEYVDVEGIALALQARGALVGPLADALVDNPPMEYAFGQSRSVTPVTRQFGRSLKPTFGNPVGGHSIQIGTDMPTMAGSRPKTMGEAAEHLTHELVHYYTSIRPGAHANAPSTFAAAAAPELAAQLTKEPVIDAYKITSEQAGYAASNFMNAQIGAIGSVEEVIAFENRLPRDARSVSRLIGRLESIESTFQAKLTAPFDASVYGGVPNTPVNPQIATFVHQEFFGLTDPTIQDIPGVQSAINQYMAEADAQTTDTLRPWLDR